jgi:hypothetical protein
MPTTFTDVIAPESVLVQGLCRAERERLRVDTDFLVVPTTLK